MATVVYLALGTNIGPREQNLRNAVRLLEDGSVQITKTSSIYETEPVDYLDQPWFLNAVVEARTDLPAADLLAALRQIESKMGSKKAFAKGPRLIDLDVLLYGFETIRTPDLVVPHPRMLERNFVLVPLAEVAPGLRHPSWPAAAAELVSRSLDMSLVRKFNARQPSWSDAPPGGAR
jgi:2-amino-4-hydroxy-6-hydroxymethyldihydropteridine diphosphokinase